MPTLSKINPATVNAQVITDEVSEIEQRMELVAMPPGFVQPVSRPIVYIGGETEGGNPFYQWDREANAKQYVETNKFSARLTDIKTIVKNPDDDTLRSVKVVFEFATESGGEVALCVGANTWAAMGIISGLSGMSSDQLSYEIGLSGKCGRKGVTFMNVFSQGGLIRNPDVEEQLKEARKDGVLIEAVEGFVGDIRARLRLVG